MMSAKRTRSGWGATWPQVAALGLGAGFMVAGLVGFGITGVHNFFGPSGGSLLGFRLNPFHDVVHVFLGVSGLLLARTLASTRTYGWLLATLYGSAFVYGLFAVGQDWDFLCLNWADNVAHLLLALAGAALAAGPVPTSVGGSAARA